MSLGCKLALVRVCVCKRIAFCSPLPLTHSCTGFEVCATLCNRAAPTIWLVGVGKYPETFRYLNLREGEIAWFEAAPSLEWVTHGVHCGSARNPVEHNARYVRLHRISAQFPSHGHVLTFSSTSDHGSSRCKADVLADLVNCPSFFSIMHLPKASAESYSRIESIWEKQACPVWD